MTARKRCPTQSCRQPIPDSFICCRGCWPRLPAALRGRILDAIEQCRLSGIKHSQELLALRDEAAAILAPLVDKPKPDSHLAPPSA